MDHSSGHGAAGLPLAGMAAAWFGSVVPDMLDQHAARRAFFRQKKFNQVHRRSSHWFGWWLAVWAWSLTGQLGPLPDAVVGGFGFGALTHVLLDMCTTHGVPLLPFVKKRFSLRLCSTGRQRRRIRPARHDRAGLLDHGKAGAHPLQRAAVLMPDFRSLTARTSPLCSQGH